MLLVVYVCLAALLTVLRGCVRVYCGCHVAGLCAGMKGMKTRSSFRCWLLDALVEPPCHCIWVCPCTSVSVVQQGSIYYCWQHQLVECVFPTRPWLCARQSVFAMLAMYVFRLMSAVVSFNVACRFVYHIVWHPSF